MKNSKVLPQFAIGEIEVSYKKIKTSFQKSTSSKDANSCIRELFSVTQINYREHMYFLYFDNVNKFFDYQLFSIEERVEDLSFFTQH